MSIATYSELTTAVANWLSRADLTSRIPEAIALAEAAFNRNIRHRQMEQRSTASATEYMSLPSDFLELRSVKVDSTPDTSLRILSPWDGDRLYTGASGSPLFYVLQANQLRLLPAPDSSVTIEIDYYKRIPALSSTATTNWLLTDYPDLYLYGSCFHALALVQDDNRTQMVLSFMNGIMDAVGREQQKARWSGSPLQTRPG